MLTIRDLADRVTQHVFADFGTFLLDRMVTDLHRHGQIRHEAVEPIARHTVWRPKGGSPCDGCRPSIAMT